MSATDERDHAEEAYLGKFCPACGDSPCTWDGRPDGFHTDDVIADPIARGHAEAGRQERPEQCTGGPVAGGPRHVDCDPADHLTDATGCDFGPDAGLQAVTPDGLELACNHCRAPIAYCTRLGDYLHADPAAAPCFLIP